MNKISAKLMIHVDGNYVHGYIKHLKIDPNRSSVVFTPITPNRNLNENEIGLPTDGKHLYGNNVDYIVLKDNYNLNFGAINLLIDELTEIKNQMEAFYLVDELGKEK